MYDMQLHLLLFSALIGLVLGIISGLTPGVHTNNFALLLVASAGIFASYGFAPIYIAVIILSNSITHTFLDIVPSIFLGAPEADTALAVLPGHRLLMDGRGMEAVRLSALGSGASIIASLILILPLAWFFKSSHAFVQEHIASILILISLLLVLSEKSDDSAEEMLGRFRFKLLACALFMLSGFLGLIAFERTGLMQPLIMFGEPSILFPVFTGIFGASTLIVSLMTSAVVPPQTRNVAGFDLPRRRIIRGILTGSAAGSLVSFLPGVSSAVATVLARLAVRESEEEVDDAGSMDAGKEFIISLSGVNTANALFCLISLYIIGKSRNGAMVAVSLITDASQWNNSTVVMLLMIILLISIVSYLLTIITGEWVSGFIHRVNYQRVCTAVLVGLFIMVILLSGWFGLVIFLTSILIGMIPVYGNVRRSHAMGVIILPIIIRLM